MVWYTETHTPERETRGYKENRDNHKDIDTAGMDRSRGRDTHKRQPWGQLGRRTRARQIVAARETAREKNIDR